MPAALLVAVGTAAHQHHRDHGKTVRNGGQQADVEHVLDAGGLDDRRQPEADAVEAHHEAEIDQSHQPHPTAGQGLGDRQVFLRSFFGLDVALEQRLFSVSQPLGVRDPVVQVEQDRNANQD